jgi:hypothetical protein
MDKEDFVMCVKETTASKESSSKDSKLPAIVKNIKTDVTMGAKTFGQSFTDAAKTLKDDGYSDAAVKDYIDRTKATVERNKPKEGHQTDGDDDNKQKKVIDTDTTTTTTGTTTTTTDTGSNTSEVSTDISGAGTTSVTAASIYTANPEDAISDQERLAQAELERQRQARAIGKASRLRTRLERTQKIGTKGRRGGSGRRSLMTGSRGGIGYYSRFK